ncbi:hypothetical protein M0R45_030110 [Rubus argutus]|uniref:Uncharacterized protein n=1 Tax=Rubus argutus TaxID=59490 RepID=A0AAW1WCK5_RUBAR
MTKRDPESIHELALLTKQYHEGGLPSPPRLRPRPFCDIPNYQKLFEASMEEYKLKHEIGKKILDEFCQSYRAHSPTPTPTPDTSNLLPEAPVPVDSNTHECKVGCIETGLKVLTVGKDSNPRPKARL